MTAKILGLYQNSAPAPTKIRLFSQIRLNPALAEILARYPDLAGFVKKCYVI